MNNLESFDAWLFQKQYSKQSNVFVRKKKKQICLNHPSPASLIPNQPNKTKPFHPFPSNHFFVIRSFCYEEPWTVVSSTCWQSQADWSPGPPVAHRRCFVLCWSSQTSSGSETGVLFKSCLPLYVMCCVFFCVYKFMCFSKYKCSLWLVSH